MSKLRRSSAGRRDELQETNKAFGRLVSGATRDDYAWTLEDEAVRVESRVQSDEDTAYDLEHTVVGSVLAGVTADRCGQCGACDRVVVPGMWATGRLTTWN